MVEEEGSREAEAFNNSNVASGVTPANPVMVALVPLTQAPTLIASTVAVAVDVWLGKGEQHRKLPN